MKKIRASGSKFFFDLRGSSISRIKKDSFGKYTHTNIDLDRLFWNIIIFDL